MTNRTGNELKIYTYIYMYICMYIYVYIYLFALYLMNLQSVKRTVGRGSTFHSTILTVSQSVRALLECVR